MVYGGSCIFCYKDPEGIKIDEASCPCGRGYVTKDGFFVNGRRVREDKVPAKRDYEEHVRLCKKCRSSEHDCFWSDEPNDYNSFFVAGSGILPQVIRQYNEDHGGPHGEVRPAEFKGEMGFLVKSRVKYNERIKEELRQQSAHAQRRDVGEQRRQEISANLRQQASPPRKDTMSRLNSQQTRRTTETDNNPRTSLPEDFNTLNLQEAPSYNITTRSNPIFPRDGGGRVLSADQSLPAQPGNVPTSIYSSSPPATAPQGPQPTTSVGHTSQPSSRQPTTPYVATSALAQPQYPAYTSFQGQPSSFATASHSVVNRGTARSERNTATYRDQQTRRDGSSSRGDPEVSRRTEQSPISRTTSRWESLDERRSEITFSQQRLPSLSDDVEQVALTRRQALQPRDIQRRPEAPEPTNITTAFRPAPSLQEVIPSRDNEMTRENPPSYPRRHPGEPASSTSNARTDGRRSDGPAENDRVSLAPTTRGRQDSTREERASDEDCTSQRQTTQPTRMRHDEDSGSRASPAPTTQRRREPVREDRPAHDRRRSSIEQQTVRVLPRTSRASVEEHTDDPRDRQPVSRATEGPRRRPPPDRERVRRP